MPRSVEEWVGKTDDTAIPDRVRLRVFARVKGLCHACSLPIGSKKWQCDHVVALILGGSNRENNLSPICLPCHKEKTAGEVAEKAKVAAIRQRHIGVKQPSGKFPKAPKPEKTTTKQSLPPRRLFA